MAIQTVNKQLDHHHTHLVTATRKLAFAMEHQYPVTSEKMFKMAEEMDNFPDEGDRDMTSFFEQLAEAIENLSSHFEILIKNQDDLINTQERTVDMLERQAIAIERIVDHLNIAPVKKLIYQKNSVSNKKTFEHHYVTSQKPKDSITEPVETPVETPVENIEPKKSIIRKRKKVVAKKIEETASTDPKLLNRKTVMDIIHSMRADGATFDQVASRLIELGQPTFSGRGEWHAQTIHRLCNKK